MTIFLIIAVVVLLSTILLSAKKRKEQKVQDAIKKEQKVQDAIKKQKNQEKMANLRERKAQKKIELQQAAEQARLEKIRREEEEQKLREEQARKYKEEIEKRVQAFKKLGLVEFDDVEEDEDLDNDYTWYEYSFVSDENLDFDKLVKALKKFDMEDSSVRVEVRATSGNAITFWLNHEGKYGAVKEAGRKLKKFSSIKTLRNQVTCFCRNEQIKTQSVRIAMILSDGVNNAENLQSKSKEIELYFTDILMASNYYGIVENKATVHCDSEIALVEYELPGRDDLSWVKEYKYVQADNSIKETMMPESTIVKTYENLIYSICLRSIYELCMSKKADEIQSIVFNGFVTAINKANGLKERKCILSLQVPKDKFLQVDLTNVDPKMCFKSFKGVSAARLIDISPVQPVLTLNKNDRRFIEGKDVQMNSGTNLAAMDWEDFEHLVRELFEMEFSRNGGEVHVTQASRDGGVDAIAFDPDPLRGGKIVIQAKRYTNTVGVSAVRDLYGTVINEGANSGILITTSDYGHDSYEFAKDKPLKLLNGGHLLALLHKNGMEGYINIQEAKDSLKDE